MTKSTVKSTMAQATPMRRWTRVEQPQLGNRAIVIGASMAGLLAARVLSERFAQVFVLDRDALPDSPAERKGTPHVMHAHGVLARGREVLEELFPGFEQALHDRGARSGDTRCVQNLVGGRMLAPTEGGGAGIACSRLLLEDEVRQRVKALSNVQLLSCVDVVEPIFDASKALVTGVRIRAASNATPGTSKDSGVGTAPDGALAADLVVDCSGRGSRTPQWLRNWGFAVPDEERVTIGVSYATAYFEFERNKLDDLLVVISTASPTMLTPAVMIAQESLPNSDHHRWVITLAGFAGDHPDLTDVGFRRRALRSGSAAIARIALEGKQLGPVLRYGFPHSQRRRYEKLQRFPSGFLVMGDSIASFNPIYGQGMTVAACEALALREALSRGITLGIRGVHRPFFSAAAKIIDTPWQIAVGADLAIPTVQGQRTIATRIINAYMSRLFRAAERDSEVALAFKKVTHLLAAPESLFSPGIVARVLWRNLLSFSTPRELQLASLNLQQPDMDRTQRRV